MSETALERHKRFLRDRIYQVDAKWPHFGRMLTDLEELAARARPSDRVVCLERSYVYGGYSLFAPLFGDNFVAVDCHTATAAERGGYQADWVSDPDCILVRAHRVARIDATRLEDSSCDQVLVPNIVHHVKDQDAMFAELARILRPGGLGYIFEALLRELHQAPDDYVRWTPWGFEQTLARHGLRLTEWRPTGGPFEVIAYAWIQALEYLPPNERAERERWFFGDHFPELIRLDRAHTTNLVRKHTSFPVAYGIFFTKD